MAGGAGAVVLHATGEVAAVEDRAYVEVAVGDFFTAAVLGGVDHGEGGDAGRCLGCLVALLVVLLSVLAVLGIFGGNLGGDALLVHAAGQAGGQHTVAGNAAAVVGCAGCSGRWSPSHWIPSRWWHCRPCFHPLAEPLLVLLVPLIAVTPDPPWDACSPFAAAFAPFGSVTCAAF